MHSLAILLLALSSPALSVLHKRLAGLDQAFCTLQADGQVFCAGNNEYGNLGLGSFTKEIPTPLQMLTVTAATDVCMGDTHSCVVDQGGQAKCVGENTFYNQLGDGTNVDKRVLANVLGLETGVDQVFCGPHTTCALLTGGGARCWGYNFYGSLGDGTTTTPTQPVQVKGFETSGVEFIALGQDHTCFLSTVGKLWCTGENGDGQLGTGTTTDSREPVPVVGLGSTNTFVSVSCAYSHTCAVTSGGAVLCWGSNSGGELGLGNRVASLLPAQSVGLATGAASVWLSWSSSFVIMQDGSVRSFGINTNGQLGNGNSTRMLSPVLFASGIANIKEIRGGDPTTCVLFQDETVQCLGSNSYGEFGSGSLTPSSSLVLVERLAVSNLPPTPTNTMPPTKTPTVEPTKTPTQEPTTLAPTAAPTLAPTLEPTFVPSKSPTKQPTTWAPTLVPTRLPTFAPTLPTLQPTRRPTRVGDTTETGGAQSATGGLAAALLGLTVLLI